MSFDWDRHVAVGDYAELLGYMDRSWAKHFERSEFLGSIVESSNHIRLSDQWGLAPVSATLDTETDRNLLVAHQGLTINGWADQVAATVFAGAVNSYARDHWWTVRNWPAIVVSPHAPVWSAAEVRRRAGEGGYAAIVMSYGPVLLGSTHYDPLYEAASEVGLPVVCHFSGVEGRYSGAAPLSGGVHCSAFSRKVLVPHLAESNIASLAFEGAFERFPGVRFLFSGVGFTWLPSLLWRVDREWRTFRHDVPWVRQPPSSYILSQVRASTWPVREAALGGDWERLFRDESYRDCVVFGSHDPIDGDSMAHLREQLGEADAAMVLGNGAELWPASRTVHA
jgi:uncharacterized protein